MSTVPLPVARHHAVRQLTTLITIALLVSTLTSTAEAGIRTNTWVTNGRVLNMQYVPGTNTIYLCGTFSQVGPATGSSATLDPSTGAVSEPYSRVVGSVYAVAPDGSGGYYLGGLFTSVQGQSRTNLAQIDASGAVTSWDPAPNGEVDVITVSGGLVYVGGLFASVGGQNRNNVAALNPGDGLATTWNPNTNGQVKFIVPNGSLIFLGGNFSTVSAASRNGIAAVNTTTGAPNTWFTGGVSPASALVVASGKLFAGVAGLAALRAYDASTGTLISLAPGPDGPITAMTVDTVTGAVYVAGDFTNIGGALRKGLAAFDPATYAVLNWKPIAFFGKDGTIESLAIMAGQVFAGGGFTNIDNNVRYNIFSAALYPADPLTVSGWDPSAGARVRALAAGGGRLLVGGDFDTVSSVKRGNVAAIDATSGLPRNWNPNANGQVDVVYVTGSTAYLGGTFSSVGGVGRSRAAAVDAQTGLVLSFNPNVTVIGAPEVTAFGLAGSTLFMAGAFSQINGVTRVGVAALDPTTGGLQAWNAGVNGAVYTMRLIVSIEVLVPPQVLIGGQFTQAGGAARSNVASLNGQTGAANPWNPSANGFVNSMIVLTSPLGSISKAYLGGGFSTIGGQPRNCLAQVDGTGGVLNAWDPSPNGSVLSIATFGTSVYVGGNFTTIGGQTRSHLAEIDNSTGLATAWDPVSAGGAPAGWVYALARINSTIYAGGSFTTMSGAPQSYFAGVFNGAITAVEDVATQAPVTVVRAAPNPFGDVTNVRFALATREHADVSVYDVQGRLVRRLGEGVIDAGAHVIPWDGLDDRGSAVGSGVYFVSVRTPSLSLGSKVYRLR